MSAASSDNARGGGGSALRTGRYASVILAAPGDASVPDSVPGPASNLIRDFARRAGTSSASNTAAAPSAFTPTDAAAVAETLAVGLAALNAFLQVNVTGPVLPESAALTSRLAGAWQDAQPEQQKGDAAAAADRLHKACLRELEVDGVAPYAYIPNLDLFALARYILVDALSKAPADVVEVPSEEGPMRYSLAWTRLRVHVWHYKLLTQPSLGPGSNFTRSSQWSDVPTLASRILEGIETVHAQVVGEVWATDNAWSRQERAQFLVEAANDYILLGRDDKAREVLKEAAQTSGLVYTLSGALGKRTKFQEKSISQLVVLAKSAADASAAAGQADEEEAAKPDALKLNDDTLLEEIDFAEAKKGQEADSKKESEMPAALQDLEPDRQPQLSPLDQIILLTEATLKDAFSPVDTLTSAEILPYAVRVIGDKSTNWQIYTQALLVRSRIEMHRSRTVERGVLQLQAVSDQVLTDTTAAITQEEAKEEQQDKAEDETPSIQITAPDQTTPAAATQQSKPTTFLPAPTASESAPAHVRLQYIHALSSPPRWHLEAELAYAWAGVGSLVSALEIFKRLRLWAEVALCLASSASADDEDGRGSGGEEKARGIVRWRLFHRTGQTSPADPDEEGVGPDDVTLLRAADFSGPERDPAPPNAPRLLCILGDLESEPAFYERAWDVSKQRYSRAQKSLGEHYLQRKEWEKARDAYRKATAVNRLSPDMWSRLGDISLRLAQFDDAAQAFSRSIGCASDTAGGEDARTWSNLGSALYSLYCEVIAEKKDEAAAAEELDEDEPVENEDDEEGQEEDGDAAAVADGDKPSRRNPAKLLAQSLAAYKKGASIAHDNWRIWDNVLTLATRMRPPSVPDMVLALKHTIRIRKSEDAVDADVLAALLQDVVLTRDNTSGSSSADSATAIYELPRGSPERLVSRLLEEDVVPLITQRSELWALVARLRGWRRDRAGAIDAAERAWRAAVGSSGSGLLPGAAVAGGSADDAKSRDWTTDADAWATVVQRTDELVSVLENWGPGVETIGQKWKGKARSAVRSVMGRGKEMWEGNEGWRVLEGLMEGLKSS